MDLSFAPLRRIDPDVCAIRQVNVKVEHFLPFLRWPQLGDDPPNDVGRGLFHRLLGELLSKELQPRSYDVLKNRVSSGDYELDVFVGQLVVRLSPIEDGDVRFVEHCMKRGTASVVEFQGPR